MQYIKCHTKYISWQWHRTGSRWFSIAFANQEEQLGMLVNRVMNHCIAVNPSSRVIEGYSAATSAEVERTTIAVSVQVS